MPDNPRWFGSVGQGPWFFGRCDDGSVRIVRTNGKRPDEGGGIEIDITIDAGSWVSIVLTMTAFNERPNDWHAFIDHHNGKADLLAKQ